MKKMSQIALGQPETAVLTADKWALLATLTDAAQDVGLNHRTLSVLRALLSFYPARTLPHDPGTAVVFPSNATLSKRLNGMPESTLRRHLAALVDVGVVSRQDSPNRKRFARRYGLAFGFDLSPLARAAEALTQTAEAARARHLRITALRDRLAFVRARLLEENALDADDPLLESARLILRRKTSEVALSSVVDRLETLLITPVAKPADSEKMSGSGSQNERHIQSTNKKISVSKKDSSDVPLCDVLENCSEYSTYFPEFPKDWQGLITASDRLHSMIGIERPTYEFALSRLGPTVTATLVLCMLEKIGQIRNPGGYLRALVTRAKEGKLNLRSMVFSCRTQKLSADNFA
ncbi:plasmid replication protein RepC [Sedimentitalea sp.]|uniref:plasmid replication protein RepC n=1 Tax=Sedimentitalea sp. TaxID=2048915 RepID=UPI0032999D86